MVDGRGGASVDMGDGLESVMSDGQEAGCTGGVKDDCRGTFVSGCTTGKTTGRGRGSCETGDGVSDWPSVDGRGRAGERSRVCTRLGWTGELT